VRPTPQTGEPLKIEILPVASPPGSTPVKTEVPVTLDQALQRWSVPADRNVRVFYTWTTKEQAAEIRRGGAVLQRSFSPGKGFASYDHLLSDLAQIGDPTARMLWHEGFAKSRFAWFNAFGIATFEEPFGDELLRITIEDSSKILTLLPHGFVPAPETADAIGAVEFHAGDYSEYILSNESAIAKVEIATPDLLAEVRAQLLFLKSVAESAPLTGPLFVHNNIAIGTKQISAAIALLTAYLHEKHEPYERDTMTKFELGARRKPIAQLCKQLGLPIKTEHFDHMGQKHFHVVTKCPPDPCWESEGRCFVHPSAFQ
jgi:hypothetical protein